MIKLIKPFIVCVVGVIKNAFGKVAHFLCLCHKERLGYNCHGRPGECD
jgi:hypothetical protein